MITSIIRHELRQTINNPKTWYLLAIIQSMLAILFKWLITNFIKNQAITQIAHYGITEEVIHPFYGWLGLMLLILLPTIATQAFCSEKQRGTMINYYCAPITGLQLLLAKFLSINILMILAIIIFSIMPITILFSGSLDWGQFIVAVFGIYLMLSAALATSLGFSMFMSNVLRSNVIIFLALTIFVMIEWAAQYTAGHAMFLQTFGLLSPLKTFLAGILSIRYIAYYILVTTCFLILGAWRYTRRWNDV